MAKPKDLDPAASPGAFFGAELRRHREAAGLSQEQLGERVYCSPTYISQIEGATRRPPVDLSKLIDRELGTDGLFGRMAESLLKSSPHAEYFSEAAELESTATAISDYATMFVPGLLQTEAYARAVYRAAQPFATVDKIEEKVATRLGRAALLNDSDRPVYWVILDEAVLRRKVGGPAVMAEQLRHIIDLVQCHRIGVQVLLLDSGAMALEGMIRIMTFEDAPDVAYMEAPFTGNLLDDSGWLVLARQRYDWVRAAALPPDASLDLIQSVAEAYANECKT